MTNNEIISAAAAALATEDRYALSQLLKTRPDVWAFVRAADNYLLAHLNRSSETVTAGLSETLLREKEILEAQACS